VGGLGFGWGERRKREMRGSQRQGGVGFIFIIYNLFNYILYANGSILNRTAGLPNRKPRGLVIFQNQIESLIQKIGRFGPIQFGSAGNRGRTTFLNTPNAKLSWSRVLHSRPFKTS